MKNTIDESINVLKSYPSMADALGLLTENELRNIVKQEAYGSVPADIAQALRDRPKMWLRVIESMLEELDRQVDRKESYDFSQENHPDHEQFVDWKRRIESVRRHITTRADEAKSLLTDLERTSNDRFLALRSAVIQHREAMSSDDYEATDADNELWGALQRIESGVIPPAK